jgi:uncharacterized protein YlaN (UPF0358 family)
LEGWQNVEVMLKTLTGIHIAKANTSIPKDKNSLMSPWQNPMYLKQVLCIFQMHKAQNNTCNINIEMQRKRKLSWEGWQIAEVMLKTLSDIHIDKANTAIPEDEEKILKVVKDGVGVDSLNVCVAEMFRKWFSTQLKEFAKELDVDVESKLVFTKIVFQNYGCLKD